MSDRAHAWLREMEYSLRAQECVLSHRTHVRMSANLAALSLRTPLINARIRVNSGLHSTHSLFTRLHGPSYVAHCMAFSYMASRVPRAAMRSTSRFNAFYIPRVSMRLRAPSQGQTVNSDSLTGRNSSSLFLKRQPQLSRQVHPCHLAGSNANCSAMCGLSTSILRRASAHLIHCHMV